MGNFRRNGSDANHRPERGEDVLSHRELLLRNPLHNLFHQDTGLLDDGSMGAVLARAGVGKTALLVQIGLAAMVAGHRVLHVSLHEHVSKICLWYEELYRNMSYTCGVTVEDDAWHDIVKNRFIMSFRASGFSIETFRERLSGLIDQHIFTPRLILIDGLDFDKEPEASLDSLAAISRSIGAGIWFSVRIHRHEALDAELPPSLEPLVPKFTVILRLIPDDHHIRIIVLKGAGANEVHSLLLDPSTMLVKDRTTR
ncbi:cytoplasmic protein [bacterium]|nr:cytoplasmic protein [candidate division CSSED10-310 bacterium]